MPPSDDDDFDADDAAARALPSSAASPGSFAFIVPRTDPGIADVSNDVAGSRLARERAAGIARVVVFFHDPDGVKLGPLTAAFAKTKLLAAQDAALIARRKSVVAAESLDAGAAAALVDALAAEGIAASCADESWVQLPPPLTTNALDGNADALVLGRGDATSRVVAPWSTVAAVAAGVVARTSLRASTVTKKRPGGVADEVQHEHELVTNEDAHIEIVLSSPPRRFRLALATMIFGNESAGRPRPLQLAERLRALAQLAEPSSLGRGIKRVAAGEQRLPKYVGARDLERELCWILWTRYRAPASAPASAPESAPASAPESAAPTPTPTSQST